MESKFLEELLGGGPANAIAVGLALVLMVVAVGIWVLELSGHTISRRGINREPESRRLRSRPFPQTIGVLT